MKTLFASLLLLLSFSSKAGTYHPKMDTIDFWHVFYNNKLIRQYNQYTSGDIISIKLDSIKAGDSITVKYFRDTPCWQCNTYLIVEYPITNQALVTHSTCTFCPLALALTDLQHIKQKNSAIAFEVYYLDDIISYKRRLFEIKIE